MAEDLQTGVCSRNWLTRSGCGFSATLALPCSVTASVINEIGGFEWSPAESFPAAKEKTDEEIADNHSASISSSCGSVIVQEAHKLEPGRALMESSVQLTDCGLSLPVAPEWTDDFIGCGRGESVLQDMLQAENFLNPRPTFRQEPSINSGLLGKDWTTAQDSNTSSMRQTHQGNLFGFEDRLNTGEYSVTGRSFLANICDSYGYHSPMLQGSLDQENQLLNMSSMNYSLNSQTLFSHDLNSSWPFKPFSSFSSSSVPPPRQQPNGHLQFPNDPPLWNSSMKGATSVRPPLYDEKIHNPNLKMYSEEISSSDTNKTRSAETTLKRPRIETPSLLPTFKVRKEKLSDRVTALQQLVSPFGKTDTASVLQEAIQYIKFLHQQVNALSNPYMKTGVQAHQNPQNPDKTKNHESTKQDLRSRGLCLVPMSSTFSVSTEMGSDFWRPSFGGNYT